MKSKFEDPTLGIVPFDSAFSKFYDLLPKLINADVDLVLFENIVEDGEAKLIVKLPDI